MTATPPSPNIARLARERSAVVAAVMPALDEEASVGRVVASLPSWLHEVVVADNGSTDRTAEVAAAAGARVVPAPRRGYGEACQRALAALDPAVTHVVFLDADASDDPDDLPALLAPLLRDEADLVIGSRARGEVEPGALLPQQRFGNWLATRLIRLGFGHRYTDLGPFRAVTREGLARLAMADRTWGWTVEMQVRALQEGLRVVEVPVRYRRRVGRSKIAGTVRGTVAAGWCILTTIARLRRRGGPATPQRPLRDQS